MTDEARAREELHIHLDLAGLAALLKAVQAAMEGGVGRLDLAPGGCGITASGKSATAYDAAIVTFAPAGDGGLDLPSPLVGRLAASPGPALARP